MNINQIVQDKTAEIHLELIAESGYEATAHYKISPAQWGDVLKVCEGDISSDTLRERDLLRDALVNLVSVSSRKEMEGMRTFLSAIPVDSQDRAKMDAALHALMVTLPEGV